MKRSPRGMRSTEGARRYPRALVRHLLVLAGLVALSGCGAAENGSVLVRGANPDRGRKLIARYGCGACHVVPGVRQANGLVGPPLTSWSQREFVAGVLPNSPGYLMRWIMTPQAVVPGNAMPDMGVTPRDAADIAAYLYTIR